MSRINCCVPYCHRTKGVNVKPLGDEWICRDHWRFVSARTKLRQRRNNKFIRREIERNPLVREYWKMKPGSPARIKAVQMWQLADAIWRKCKAEAIERAVGL